MAADASRNGSETMQRNPEMPRIVLVMAIPDFSTGRPEGRGGVLVRRCGACESGIQATIPSAHTRSCNWYCPAESPVWISSDEKRLCLLALMLDEKFHICMRFETEENDGKKIC